MTAAGLRRAVAIVVLVAVGGCDRSEPASAPTEGDPPLAVIPAHPPRPALSLEPETSRVLGPGAALARFFAALEAIERGDAREPAVVIQIGDSHSAGDLLSGRLRELLQQRFGAAGRGLLPPGIPYPYYKPDQVRIEQAGAWQRVSSLRAAGPFGVAGVIQQSAARGDWMTLTATEPAGFDRAFFEVLRQPGGGALRLQVDDGEPHIFATTGNGAHWIEFDAPPHSHRLALTAAGDASATVLGWGTQRQGPGIVYENLGISGATIGVAEHWDQATVVAELQRRDPVLLVVAYGSNEAVEPPAKLATYAERFAARVDALHAAIPGAAVLVIGPPDLDRHGQPPASGCTADWAPPPGLATVLAAQHAVAERQGWYFWDWQAAMGGPCAADRWTRETPPLEYPDHIHQTADGYRRTADPLFAMLMNEYRRYRLRPVPAG